MEPSSQYQERVLHRCCSLWSLLASIKLKISSRAELAGGPSAASEHMKAAILSVPHGLIIGPAGPAERPLGLLARSQR